MAFFAKFKRPSKAEGVSPDRYNIICDRCGAARAVSRITLMNGAVLHFCGHHTDEHMVGFLRDGARIEDLRNRPVE